MKGSFLLLSALFLCTTGLMPSTPIGLAHAQEDIEDPEDGADKKPEGEAAAKTESEEADKKPEGEVAAKTDAETAAGASASDAPEGMIDMGENPLSPEDMKKVMSWIAQRAASLKMPFCWRDSYGRGAGEPYACPAGLTRTGLLCYPGSKPLNMGTCGPNLEKNGALCYPNCKENFHGNGPVCWQNCPKDQSHNCGAACSKNESECAKGVVNMVFGPIIVAATIVSTVVTFGGAAVAGTVIKTAVKEGVKKAVSAAAKGLMVLTKSIKEKMLAASLEDAVGGADKLQKLRDQSPGGKHFVPKTPLLEEIDQFSKEYADDFAGLTSADTAEAIDSKFGPEGAYQIKRQYGLRHVAMMLEADKVKQAQAALSAVAAADPSGIADAVKAFVKPKCLNAEPFPDVTPIYTR